MKVEASIVVAGRIHDAEQVWFDPNRWPSWVDGFGHVAKLEGDWPQPGSRLQWDSPPAGRGRVVEKVIRYDPRVEHIVEVEDAKLRGTQTVRFHGEGVEATRITVELEYELKNSNPFTPLVNALFVRRSLRDSLQRTLAKFANERRAEL